jgi:hypothetical protein
MLFIGLVGYSSQLSAISFQQGDEDESAVLFRVLPERHARFTSYRSLQMPVTAASYDAANTTRAKADQLIADS